MRGSEIKQIKHEWDVKVYRYCRGLVLTSIELQTHAHGGVDVTPMTLVAISAVESALKTEKNGHILHIQVITGNPAELRIGERQD